MTDTENHPMSPSLAGIVNDPNDSGRRIVPASQRADGSIRKERKVRPGHVPAEDVAKYRPGQGSLRAQHAAAQASHQAPPSPSPTPASSIARRPNPADFLTEVKAREQQLQQQQPMSSNNSTANIPAPPASPTKASASAKSGASSSRWATAPAVVEAAPSPAPAPAALAPTAPHSTAATRGKPRTRGGARQGKVRAVHEEPTPSATTTEEEEKPIPVAPEEEPEDAKENIVPDRPEERQEKPTPAQPSIPRTPESKIPDLPETPGGDWWADEDDDEDVDAAAQALQGISIKDTAASRHRQGSPTPPPPSALNRASHGQQQQSQQQERNNLTSKSSNGQQHNTHRESHNKTPAKKAQQQQSQKATTTNSRTGPADLLSRLGPPVPQPPPAEAEKAAPVQSPSRSFNSLTIDEVRARARTINQQIRQLNQLKKYAEAGAVLSAEQKHDIDGAAPLLQELGELKSLADSLASEITQLFEAANR
ncbi:hypothetical protein P389DRAFT_75597 [Cystobasidium minutum MCA 4210]|uniref:uncharacterized protein n=1 Tax=Cystobasidium minutum MCA 4210 TaxID=1397322 RepID=UPI0034CD7282|eukprot:jgi/Rhomi1/75597/CE75596_786